MVDLLLAIQVRLRWSTIIEIFKRVLWIPNLIAKFRCIMLKLSITNNINCKQILQTLTLWSNSKTNNLSVICSHRILSRSLIRVRARKSTTFPWTSSRKKMRRKTTLMINILTPILIVMQTFKWTNRCRAVTRVMNYEKRQTSQWWCRIIKNIAKMRSIVIMSIHLVIQNMRRISTNTQIAMIVMIRIKTRLRMYKKPPKTLGWKLKNPVHTCNNSRHQRLKMYLTACLIKV